MSDNEFAQFYGEINDRIAPFGFSIDILSDEGIGPIDLDQLESDANNGQRIRTKRWMAFVSAFDDFLGVMFQTDNTFHYPSWFFLRTY